MQFYNDKILTMRSKFFIKFLLLKPAKNSALIFMIQNFHHSKVRG